MTFSSADVALLFIKGIVEIRFYWYIFTAAVAMVPEVSGVSDNIIPFFSYPQAAVSTPIFVSNLACDTSNSGHLTIYHCPRSAGTACFHSQDVALVCSSPYSTSKHPIVLCQTLTIITV